MQTLYDAIEELRQEFHKLNSVAVDEDLTDEDLEFILRTRQAQKEIDEGKGITVSAEQFLDEIKSW